MTPQELFKLGMKRDVKPLLDFPEGIVLNLGCGKHVLDDAVNLDYPEWNAENYVIEVPNAVKALMLGNTLPHPEMGSLLVSCPSESVTGIHAYHFLEHLHDPRRMLREMQRVLIPGGVLNICVPHYWGSMAHHDLDHKHNFALDTWDNTFSAPWYDKDRSGWRFRIHFNMMMAITERNAAIITQLVKE